MTGPMFSRRTHVVPRKHVFTRGWVGLCREGLAEGWIEGPEVPRAAHRTSSGIPQRISVTSLQTATKRRFTKRGPRGFLSVLVAPAKQSPPDSPRNLSRSPDEWG